MKIRIGNLKLKVSRKAKFHYVDQNGKITGGLYDVRSLMDNSKNHHYTDCGRNKFYSNTFAKWLKDSIISCVPYLSGEYTVDIIKRAVESNNCYGITII